MPDNNYRYLKDLQNNVIKPVTDLAAVNLTTANGLLVNGNTIGVENGYVASCAYLELTDPATAANPDSAYIEGGTMFQLIGGYTVTDEIPPITGASHERIPSEYSVRSAIDALAILGPSMAPGAGIVVEIPSGTTVGTIYVAEGNGIRVNTAQQGGVSVNAAAGGGISVDSNGVAVNVGNGMAVDGSNNINVVAKTSGGLVVDSAGIGVVVGDTIDLTGGTVNVKVADLSEVLTGLVSGSTVGDSIEEVTPDNLRGALSIGQAVDVSCAPYNNSGSISYTNDDFLQGFTATMAAGTTVGFYGGTASFPKFAPTFRYLMIADVSGTGTITLSNETTVTLDSAAQRIALLVTTDDTGYFSAAAAATVSVANWRQYEVTALTKSAIEFLSGAATNPNPDAFFREPNIYNTTTGNIRDKYLVKQDMVCPFIPTISMPDNSDLTIGAGLSYKIKYTDNNIHKISVVTIPVAAYGLDAHIQLFITETSSIQFQPPLVLMNPLTANADHNLSVKFRNGQAMVYVEDSTPVG